MNVQLVPEQIEAHKAYKARQARKLAAARKLMQKQEQSRRRQRQQAPGFPKPIFPWPKPVHNPVYVDHNAHVITYRTNGISFERIRQDAILASGLPWSQIISPRRDFDVVKWRQSIMHALYKLTSMSLPEIGRKCGNKDHTTVLHGVRKVNECIASGHTDKIVGVTGITFHVRNDYIGKSGRNR